MRRGTFLVELVSSLLLPRHTEGLQSIQQIEEQDADETKRKNAAEHLHIIHLCPCAEDKVADSELGRIILRKKEGGKRDADADPQAGKELRGYGGND